MREHQREPIIIPRWVLTVKYAVFILLGVTVFIASSPAVDEVTPDWLTPIWGIGISVSAVIALVGSLTQRLEVLERWACAVLASLFLVFALAPIVLVIQGDEDRAMYSVIALGFALLPIARAAQLLSRTGMQHG